MVDEHGRAGARKIEGISHPLHIPPREWWLVAKRAVREGLDDGVTNLSAGLTYYSVMSLFPGLIVVVALLALIGQESTTRTLLDIVGSIGPDSAVETVRDPIEGIIASRGTSRALLSISIVISVVSASAFIGAFTWAANHVYEVEGRPFLKALPRKIILALALLVTLALIAAIVVLTGPVAATLADAVGLGDEVLFVYGIARWPILFVVTTLLFSVLYYFAPNVRQPKFRWVTPGGFVGVLIWLVATVGLTVYVNSFGNYSATYGALAGVIVFLLWLWIFNIALLAGLEVDVELERRRQELRAGVPSEGPPLPQRDEGVKDGEDGVADEDGRGREAA